MTAPQTETDLAEVIGAAQVPFRIRGGGTRPLGHAVDAAPLSLARMSGITLYEPGALTLVVKSGTPIDEIDKALDAEGQRLAFEPMDHRGLLSTDGASTIGGVTAANISGPRRIQAGAARDFLLGVRFVDGRGQIIRNGGRVMKNVTGYDLVKLMAGSYGTLGVLTEIALKVLPKPEMTAVLLCEGLGDAVAIGALSRALGSPYEVTGAAHLQRGMDGAPLTMIRLEGFERSVGYRAAQLQALLAEFGVFALQTDPAKTHAGWRCVRDVAPFHGRKGDVWRLSVKPTEAPCLAARLPEAEVLYDWGGGLIWALVPEGTDLREQLGAFEGHATVIRASTETRARLPVFHPQPAQIERLQDGLRQRFDPRGLFNPGLMRPAT